LYRERYLNDLKEEEEVAYHLENAPSGNFNDCERRCYELLVKMEKEIGWETLLRIKTSTFFTENENPPWDNPHFIAEFSKSMKEPRKKQLKEGLTEESFYGVREAANKFAENRKLAKDPPGIRNGSDLFVAEIKEELDSSEEKSSEEEKSKPKLEDIEDMPRHIIVSRKLLPHE
jgi:hypothetical protein